MPRYDRTEPFGAGPGTGRGFGPCGFELGWRRRYGGSRGLGKYFPCWDWPEAKEDQKTALADYRRALEEEFEDVKKEEEELESAK